MSYMSSELNLKILFPVIFYAFFDFGSLAIAETKVLVLDGGASAEANYYRYYNNSRRAYEVSKKIGFQPSVYAKDGKWKVSQSGSESLSNYAETTDGKKNINPKGKASKRPDYPPVKGPLGSSADMAKAIKALNLKPGDRLIIQMTGHGTQLADKKSAYWFFNKAESWNQVGDALKKIDPGVSVQLQTSACYGGGVHQLARRFPNVCSVSSTQAFSVSYSSDDGNEFTNGFWDQFNRTGAKTTLGEASMAAFKNDSSNEGRGSLSSFDYMAYVLKKPPYDKAYQNADKKAYKPIFSLDPNEDIYQESHKCSIDQIPKIINSLSKNVDNIVKSLKVQSLKNLPPKFVSFLHQYTGAEDKDYKDYMRELGKLQKEWEEHKAKFKDSWDITKWWHNEGEKRAAIESKLANLKIMYKSSLASGKFHQDKLGTLLKSLSEFKAKATPAQLEKFQKMLECEWGKN